MPAIFRQMLYAPIIPAPIPSPPPPPPAPSPSPSITLSGPTNVVAGATAQYTVTAQNLTGPITVTPVNVSGTAVFSPVTLTPAPGELSKLFTATWASLQSASIKATSPGIADSNTISVSVAAAPSPVPPPPPAVSPLSTGSDVTFSVSSTSGVTNEVFSVGAVLSKGQFPSSSGISVSGLSNYQVKTISTWSDGSAKNVLISGRVSIPSNSTNVYKVRQGVTPTGTNIDESMLSSSGVDATLQFGDGPVMTLSSLIGVQAVSNSTGLVTNGRVKQVFSGHEMSSWLYAARLSSTNSHVVGWMEVRLYSDGKVNILPWVENGWTRVSGCVGHVGNLIFAINGATRFSQNNVHLANHCRVVAQDVQGVGYWSGSIPDVYAIFDPQYLQSTKMVPSFFPDTTVSDTELTALSRTYSPSIYGQLLNSPRDVGGNGTNNGDYDNGMANAGYHAGIGLLPAWDVYWLTSGDKRAWDSVIANAMGYGRYGVHFRDEITLEPVNPLDVPNKTLPQGSNHNIADIGANQFGAPEILPVVGGYDAGSGVILKPEYWAKTHHPCGGFLAYILTGYEFFLQLNQFVAGTCFLQQNNLNREYGLGLQKTHISGDTVRGQAWGLRSIFQAASISKDGSALKIGFSTISANNINYYNTQYITGPLGISGAFGTPRNTANFRPETSSYRVNAFEYDFSCAAWGYGLDLEPVSGSLLESMRTYTVWHLQWPVVRLGPLGDANSFGFNCAARNNFIAIAPGSDGSQWNTNTGWYSNPGQMFAETPGGSNATNTVNTIGSYTGDDSTAGFFPDATSYWGNLQMAISYAVDHDVPGALDAYNRMINATNWGLFETDAITAPGYAHRPRKVFNWGTGANTGSIVGDLWTPGKDSQGRINKSSWEIVPSSRWIKVSNTRIDTQLTSAVQELSAGWTSSLLWGTTAGSNMFQSWSGFTIPTTSGKFWFFGGGHSDGHNNGLYRFDISRMQWGIECAPSSWSEFTVQYRTNGDATFHPDSMTASVSNFNNNNPAGTTLGTLVPAVNGVFFDENPPDGKPTARHTYHGVTFAPNVGSMGFVYMHMRRLWGYDIASGKWVFKRLFNDQARSWANPLTGQPAAPSPNAVYLRESHAGEASVAIWDEATNRVLCSASGSTGAGSLAYNQTSNTWQSWGGAYSLNFGHAAMARNGRTVVFFSPPTSEGTVYKGRYWVYNMDTGTVPTGVDVQLGGGLSYSAFPSAGSFYDGEAMVYVPPLNRYWIFTRSNTGGMQVLQLDPTTTPWTLSPLTFANANPMQQQKAVGRVHWIESMGAVMAWDHCFTEVELYKI